jgi:hypothetical protein
MGWAMNNHVRIGFNVLGLLLGGPGGAAAPSHSACCATLGQQL